MLNAMHWRRHGVVWVCRPDLDTGRTGQGNDRRTAEAQGSGPGVRGRLQRQSRVPDPQGRPRHRELQIVHSIGRRDDGRRHGPEDRDDCHHTVIGVIKAGALRGQGVRAIVANLMARRLGGVQIVTLVGICARMIVWFGMFMRSRQCVGADSPGRFGQYPVGVRFRRVHLQQAGIGKPRSQSEQPHRQHHHCGVALGAGAPKGVHVWCGKRQFMLRARHNHQLIHVKRKVGRMRSNNEAGTSRR